MMPTLPRLTPIAFFFATGQLLAADVGRVLLAVGDTVAARDKQVVKLVLGSMVQDKDVLRTGPTSNLQVRFIDESVLAMRENSEVRIDEFRFTGKEDGTERAFFRLLKGGLRKVTGIVGRTNHKNYQMSTIVATIGVRGTDYAATLCQRDCRNPDGTLARDGLYGRAIGPSFGTNRLAITNERGEFIFGITQDFLVPDGKTAPGLLLQPTDFLYDKLAATRRGGTKGEAGGTGKERAATGGAQHESRGATPAPALPRPVMFVNVADPAVGPVSASQESSGSPIDNPALAGGGTVAGPTAAATPPAILGPTPTVGAVGAYVDASGQASDGGAYVTPSMLTFNGSGVITGFNIPAGTTEVDGGTVEPPGVIGTATSVAESGAADPGDGSINARWVRWGSTITDDTGTSMLPGGFHGMIGNLAPPEVVAGKSGTFSFSTVGGTTPTNNLGQTPISAFSYPSLTVNFTSRVASFSAFSWAFPANSWSFPSVNANVIITPGKGAGVDGLSTGGACTGTGCAGPITLGVTGIFYGPRGDHLGAAFAGQSGSAKAMGVKLYTCAPSC